MLTCTRAPALCGVQRSDLLRAAPPWRFVGLLPAFRGRTRSTSCPVRLEPEGHPPQAPFCVRNARVLVKPGWLFRRSGGARRLHSARLAGRAYRSAPLHRRHLSLYAGLRYQSRNQPHFGPERGEALPTRHSQSAQPISLDLARQRSEDGWRRKTHEVHDRTGSGVVRGIRWNCLDVPRRGTTSRCLAPCARCSATGCLGPMGTR
jgi:hypothetical protein